MTGESYAGEKRKVFYYTIKFSGATRPHLMKYLAAAERQNRGYMIKYVVDFTGCQSLRQIHAHLKEVFDFPDYYGANWDAFWDCIREMIGDDPMCIEIHGFADLQKLSEKHANIFKKCMDNVLKFADGMYSHITFVKFID